MRANYEGVMTDSPLSNESASADELDVKTSPEPSAGAEDVSAGSESSAGPQGVENKSMLDAIQAAVKTEKSPGSEQKSEDSKADDQAKTKAEDGKAGKKPDEMSEEEIAAMTPNQQRRIRELNDRMKAAEAETETYKGKAENFDRVVGFMQKSNLTSSDVNNGFEIMAAIKNDPTRALEMLAPIMRTLMAETGNVLPDDLRAQVESGEISEAHAVELSRLRANTSLSEKQRQVQAEREQEQRAADERQKQVDTSLRTADAWSTEKRKLDPDWDKKHPLVAEKIDLRVRTEGFPKSEQEMRQWLDDALTDVEKRIKAFLPKPKAIDPKIPTGGSERAAKAPETMLDVVRQVANG